MSKPRPTDEEFAELARKRDEDVERLVAETCRRMGWDRKEITFHASHQHGCYCACPDGPCQHSWDGPTVAIGLEEGEDPASAPCHSVTCSRCGADAMSHDMRCAP